MNEPQRIAAMLAREGDGCAAAILVAMAGAPSVAVLREDSAHLVGLRRLGCINRDRLTPIGQRVALVLRSLHGVEPALREAKS